MFVFLLFFLVETGFTVLDSECGPHYYKSLDLKLKKILPDFIQPLFEFKQIKNPSNLLNNEVSSDSRSFLR